MIVTITGNHNLKLIDGINEKEGLKNGGSKTLKCDDHLAVDNKTFDDDAFKHGKTQGDNYFH